MKKRFIVALDSCTPEQSDAITQYFKDKNVGWWHWLTNLWLVSDSKGQFKASDIRNALKEIAPGVYTMVLEIRKDGDTWSGLGPGLGPGEKDMFKWIRNNWKA